MWITIRFNGNKGVFNLSFPDYFLNARRTCSKKIFDWLFEFSYFSDNQNAITYLDAAFPALIRELEDAAKNNKDEKEKRRTEKRLEKAKKLHEIYQEAKTKRS